jgi:trk system potassium uptake protein TrkH
VFVKAINKLAFITSITGLFVFLFDFGYDQSLRIQSSVNFYYFIVLIIGIFATIIRYFDQTKRFLRKVIVFDIITLVFTIDVLFSHFYKYFMAVESTPLYHDLWVKFAIFLTFIREFSEQKVNFKRTLLNPAQLFIFSFLFIILSGAFLLMLPNASYQGISFIDALFTSTSAVCVTGLIVVDTGSYFTFFGQSIIMLLIQIGGLGILTFASYFSYFFIGGSTYETQLTLGEMTNSKKLGEVFTTLKYIILITLAIEIFAAILIFFSLSNLPFSFFEKVYFSFFHSVSAFCNAGFSTLPNSLYETEFKFNYGLQLVIIFSFVLGGLGFPILVNLINYTKYKLLLMLNKRNNKEVNHMPWILNINSRITLITTIALTVVGFILYYILEYNYTLEEHGMFGKLVVSLFGATTPRTAGFNNVDMTALTFPTVMMIFLLMWVGASPASTGGGIKTSTFAIATLNILSIARGKSRIEIYRRKISNNSIRRAFAIISLSLIVIGGGIMLISIFDPEKGLLNIAFECFSAYSTVGLSLGITGSLSTESKFVLSAIMFVGRVSMLTLVIAMFKKEKFSNYRYPTEEILIN